MFQRFTDRAGKIMTLANQEAQRFNHEYIGTEHILLGLVAEGSGVAAAVLREMGVELAAVRAAVEGIVHRGPVEAGGSKRPLTPRAKKVFEYAVEESRGLGRTDLGTEHLLLGLLREHDGVAGQVLGNLGVTLGRARGEVAKLVGAESDCWKVAPVAESTRGSEGAVLPLPAGLRCPMCGYDRAGSAARICPECGYVTTDVDLSANEPNERRLVFLEATPVRAWAPIGGLVVAAFLLRGPVGPWVLVAPAEMVAVALGSVGLALISGLVMVRRLPGFHRRLVWRAWVMCLGWTQLPWLMAGVVPWLYFHVLPYSYAWSAQWAVVVRLVVVGSVIGMVVGVGMWRWNWRRVAAVGGLPSRPRSDPGLRRALAWAFGLVPALLWLCGVLWVLGRLADWIYPRWIMP
jgi:hypothetical protein